MPNPSHTHPVTAVDLTTCPKCGDTAEVPGRDIWESTEHVRMLCAAGHGRGAHTGTAQCPGPGAHSPGGR